MPSALKRLPLLTVMLVCCGGDGDPYGRTLGPEPATCAASWKRVYAPKQGALDAIPFELAWNDGRLYYGDANHDDVLVLSESGASLTAASGIPLTFRSLWFEGDRVTFVRSVWSAPPETRYDHHELTTVGPTGGPALTVMPFTVDANSQGAWAFDLTPDALYAAVAVPEDNVRLSRFDRSTGAEQVLGVVKQPGPVFSVRSVVVAGDWLFVDATTHPFSFPIAGGSAIFAKTVAGDSVDVSGVSRSGEVLWAGSHSRGKRSDPVLALGRVGSADAPRKLDAGLPRDSAVTHAWSDGNGGWYVEGLQTLADGAIHVVVWWVDPAGKAHTLACDPEAGRYVVHGAASPAGIFLAASFQQLGYYTEIAFIPR